MNPHKAVDDSDMENVVVGRKLPEMEKWSLRIIHASGVSAAAFSATAEATTKGGATMLSDAILNDGDISPIFSFKFFGHK